MVVHILLIIHAQCEMLTYCWVNELDVHTPHPLQLSDLLLITLQEDISTHTALMRLSVDPTLITLYTSTPAPPPP